MFLLVRQCAEPMTELQRLKIKVIGFTLELRFHSTSDLLNPLKDFIKFWLNAYLIKAVCRALHSTTQTMGQGTP